LITNQPKIDHKRTRFFSATSMVLAGGSFLADCGKPLTRVVACSQRWGFRVAPFRSICCSDGGCPRSLLVVEEAISLVVMVGAKRVYEVGLSNGGWAAVEVEVKVEVNVEVNVIA
jgi:hypothetical protein